MTAPLFSIITPVHNPPAEVLERMLASVRSQTFTDWEHCIVDDAGGDSTAWPLLERAAADEPRLRIRRSEERGGIVAASNAALELAQGDFLALLDHDDELAPGALEAMARRINADAELDVLYSDEDKLGEGGRHYDRFVKPAWSPDRLRSQMYVGHLSVLRRTLAEEVGGFRPGYDGSQDWDLWLRASAAARRVERVPEVLYHWRAVGDSAATDLDAKPWAHEASRRALTEQIERDGIEATVEQTPGYPGHYWLAPALRDKPLVSVVIPTAGQTQEVCGVETPLVVNCVRSIIERSSYENLEFVVVADTTTPTEVLDELRAAAGRRLRLVEYEPPFNFSAKINLGVQAAAGDYLLLLNDDIEVLPPTWRPSPPNSRSPVPDWPLAGEDGRRAWLEAMLVYAKQPGVGAVGAKLYFPDGNLQHVGVAIMGGAPGHPFYGAPGNSAGYFANLIVATNHLAVTAACMLTRRESFELVGGFNEDFPVNYNDVDFCLELHSRGLRSVCLPWVELLHRESASRGKDPVSPPELDAFRSKWGERLAEDPYYDRSFVGGNYGFDAGAAAASYRMRARQLLREGGVRVLVARSLGFLRRRARERLRRR